MQVVNQKIKILSYAKVNLFFNILNRQINGYHEVLTLMQSVSLADTLVFQFNKAKNYKLEIRLKNKFDIFPVDGSNLISQAIEMFRIKASLDLNYHIQVDVTKNIPIGAGLGGGSSNAAATLVLLNKLFDNILNSNDLCDIASQLGCDVAFNLKGGLALAEHFGEKLISLNDYPIKYYMVLIKPDNIDVSTVWAYREYDSFIAKNPTQTESVKQTDYYLDLIKSGNLTKLYSSFSNSFENVIFELTPELKTLYQVILSLKPQVSHLTGSGSCIYALFDGAFKAQKFIQDLKLKKIAIPFSTWYVEPLNCGNYLNF